MKTSKMKNPIQNINIDKIIRSKRRTISLVVTADAKLIVRAPLHTSLGYIKNLIKQKIEWIAKKQEAAIRRNETHIEKQFVDGEKFLFMGDSYELEIKYGKAHIELKQGKLIIHEKEPDSAPSDLKSWYRKQAKLILSDRVSYLSKVTGIGYKSVKITEARKRWGSCSTKNTLNYAWRLVMTPLNVIDYVIIHELVHVEFHNHSKHFWDRVEAIMPDYKKHRKWLKENQRLMELM